MPLGAESGRCVPNCTPAAGLSISGPLVSRLLYRSFAPSFRVIRLISRRSRSKILHTPRKVVLLRGSAPTAAPVAGAISL